MNMIQELTDTPRSLFLSCFALLLLVVPVTALADSGNESTSAEQGTSPSRTEALRTDAEAIAEQEGWDVDDVVARLERQEEFGELTSELFADYPDSYGGAWTETEVVDGAMHIRFVGEVPPPARKAAERRGLSVTFHSDAKNSREELAERARGIRDELIRDGYPGAVGTYSVRDEQIIGLATRAGKDERSDQERRAQMSDEARASDVVINFTDDRVAGNAHTYGGGQLINYWSGYLMCTTGFTHTDGDGNTGVLSAGHCSDYPVTHYRQEDGVRFQVDEGGVHRGEYGDIMGYHTSHLDFAEFHATYGDGNRRDVEEVESWWNIEQGQIWCKFGRTSGYSCDFVYHPSIWVEFDGIRHDRMVAMETRQTDNGDSGGPWFVSNTAAGITSGWVNDLNGNGLQHSTWSKAHFVSYIWSNHDLEVLTK